MFRVTCMAVLLLLIPSASLAQDGESSVSEGRARALFEAGRAAITEGDYEGAHRYFQEAYDLSQRPRLLFNIANAAERLRNDDEAVRLYRQFLEEVPDAENRTYVEGRIRALGGDEDDSEQQDDSGDADGSDGGDAVQRDADHESAPVPSGGGGDPTGWIMLGGGAALAVGGAVLLGVGASERAAVDAASVGEPWSDYEGAHNTANALMPTGGVLLGVGAALAVVGFVVAVTSGGEDSQTALRVGPGAVSVEGSF